MTKKELEELGIQEEAQEKIISSFQELKKQLEEQKNQESEFLKLMEDHKTQSETLAQLQNDHKVLSETHATEVKKMKADAALDLALLNAKAKNLKAARAILSFDQTELDQDGNLVGLSEILEKTVKEHSYLFGEDPVKEGYQPVEHTKKSQGVKADPTKMTYDQFLEAQEL